MNLSNLMKSYQHILSGWMGGKYLFMITTGKIYILPAMCSFPLYYLITSNLQMPVLHFIPRPNLPNSTKF